MVDSKAWVKWRRFEIAFEGTGRRAEWVCWAAPGASGEWRP